MIYKNIIINDECENYDKLKAVVNYIYLHIPPDYIMMISEINSNINDNIINIRWNEKPSLYYKENIEVILNYIYENNNKPLIINHIC